MNEKNETVASRIRFNNLLETFVKALLKYEKDLKQAGTTFSYAKLNYPEDSTIVSLETLWQNILGGAYVIGLSEKVLEAKRLEIEKRLGYLDPENKKLWFDCKYKVDPFSIWILKM
jgi:hypothetical protein